MVPIMEETQVNCGCIELTRVSCWELSFLPGLDNRWEVRDVCSPYSFEDPNTFSSLEGTAGE